MLSLWNISLLVALLCSHVLSQGIDPDHGLAGRQIFVSLATSCTGTSCPKTSSKSSSKTTSTSVISRSSTTTSSSSVLKTSSAKASTLSLSSRISTASSTTSTTPTISYNPRALTTTFTQPPACTGGITAIEDWGTVLYNNLIISSAGYTLAYTSCFPPQFYSSVLSLAVSTNLPPFSALICPSDWENYELNSTYVVCCPSGYNLVAPNYVDPVRPGLGAACSSYIAANALMDITTFDHTGGETVVPMTVGPDGTVVWANAFDGITTSAANTSTSSRVSSSIPTSSVSVSQTLSSSTSIHSSSSSSKPASSNSAATTKSSTTSTSLLVSKSTTSSTSTSKTSITSTQPAVPISTDGRCGANVNGATCKGSVFGNCCSVKGNCGSTPAFCGTTNLCQPGYGTCTPVSTDGKCGSASTTNAMCLGSSFGDCCSVKGNCGSTPAFCGTTNLCQPRFGNCTPVSTDGKCGSASSTNAMCLGSSFGDCCSVKGNCGSTPAFCGTTNLCQLGFGNCTPVSTDGKCGSASSTNAMCLGSTYGDCCSVKGNCGKTDAFCSLKNLCQANFGTCTA